MDRSRARVLARDAIARGEALAWFEALYREADAGTAVVPWADLVPNPHLVNWLDAHPTIGGRALDVGTGFGDNAEELARRGMAVVAFDVAATAVARTRARFPRSSVRYLVADLLDPPADWRGTFDLVAETYTLTLVKGDRRHGIALMLTVSDVLMKTKAQSDTDDPLDVNGGAVTLNPSNDEESDPASVD